MISLLRQGSDPMRSGPLVRSKKRRHRGRTVSYPNRPRTGPGVPFSSTGLFGNTRFRVGHQEVNAGRRNGTRCRAVIRGRGT